MVKREKSNYMIQSVKHAGEVLDELSKAKREMGVTELATTLRLHKNNVFRILATLELLGLAEQNPDTENYRLGVKVLELGQSYLLQSNIVALVSPVLKRLSESIGETVSFATLHQGMVQYPLSFASKHLVMVSPREGTYFPAKQCVSGRLLTAHLTDEQLAEELKDDTPQDAAIRNQLTELRTNGVLIDRGGLEADVVCISHVVKSLNGRALGAVEVIVPQYRAKIDQILSPITVAVESLSSAFGAEVRQKTLAELIEKEVVPAEDIPLVGRVSGSDASSGAAAK